MTENTSNTPEPLEVPLQEPPAEPTAMAAQPKSSNSTRTLLEVGGAAIAAVLIAAAAVFGFVAGQFTSDNHNRDEARMSFQQHQDGQGRGQGMQPGQGMPGQGMQNRGVDPDGDNWTGQNQQGQPGAPAPAPAPSTPSQAG